MLLDHTMDTDMTYIDGNEPTETQATEIAAAGLRTFFNIAAAWKLNDSEQAILLGLAGTSALSGLREGRVALADAETLERLSLIFGIFRALNTIFAAPEHADEWLRRPNKSPLFEGRTALDRMLMGNVSDLYAVRRHLDAECGPYPN